MKKFLLSLVVLFIGISMNWADEPFRQARYDGFKVLQPAEGGIVMIGNSITDMHIWNEVFRDKDGKCLPISNRGNSGSYATQQSENLESYLGNKPAKVFMMIGTNDIATSGGLNTPATPDVLLKFVQNIVTRIHARCAETEVYLYPIINNSTGNRVEATWLAYNELLKTWIDGMRTAGNTWLTFVDFYDTMSCVAQGGAWSNDKLHPNAAAFKKWATAIKPYLGEGVTSEYDALSNDLTSVQKQDGLSSMHGGRATMFSVMPISSEDILFFGDAEVKTAEWWELLGNNNIKNRGTGWNASGDIATTSKEVDATFASTGVTKSCPKAILLYTGTADFTGSTDIATVQSNYKALVDKVKSKASGAKIYVMSLHGRYNNASLNTGRLTTLNNWLRDELAGNAGYENVKFIDTYAATIGTDNNPVADYVNSNNYLTGKGSVKFAQAIRDALSADFNDVSFTVLTDEQAAERWQTVTDASYIRPVASTDGDEHWYQIVSNRSTGHFVTATGATDGVIGSTTDYKYANSMWKFVDRGDGTYDIINRKYGSYISPTASYNTQISCVASIPSAGWTLKNANTMAHFAFCSGEVELNQTGSPQTYKIYNWSSSSNKGNDLGDVGCQLRILDAPEPMEEPDPDPEPVDPITYTVDKTTGTLYGSSGAANQSWNNSWKSTTTPQLVFGCGPNNMNWSGNTLQLMTGSKGSATYSITAPSGYVISSYSFDAQNNSHTTGLSLVMDGKTYTTSQTVQTLSKSSVYLQTVSFDLTGTNGKGLLMNNFTVTIIPESQAPVAGLPEISTEGNEHWYYIVNAAASSVSYCTGKVINYTASSNRITYSDKLYMSDRIWSFWEKDGKLAIKNYDGIYFGTPGSGTGNSTQFGKSDTPNYIYSIEASNGAFIIKDSGVELHAQKDNSLIVRWAAGEGNASLWRFEEVDASGEEARVKIASTTCTQAKVTTGIGNTDVPIMRATLHVDGLKGSIELQGINVTVFNPRYVKSVKVYEAYNERELFVDPEKKMPWRDETGTLLGKYDLLTGPSATTTSEKCTINVNKVLTPGDYFIWIAFDIEDGDIEGKKTKPRITGYIVDGEEVNEDNGNCANYVQIFLSEGTALMPKDRGVDKTNGSMYYRIPAITSVVKDGKTRLVVLTDDRLNHNADLPSHCYVVSQYSDDLGKTWTEPNVVAGTASTGGDYGHGDASLVTNRNNGEIIGIMTSSPYGNGFFASTPEKPQAWKTIKSVDGGETWSTPVDHTKSLYAVGSPNPTWKGGFSGSGAALQLRDGTLVSSFVNRDGDNVQNFVFFMSEDNGDSWHVQGTSGTTGADEPKTLERNNGDLAISVRASGYNYHNVTSDRGMTWKKAPKTRFTSGISGNACDGEYMVWCATKDGNPWDVAFQTCPDNSSRQNLSIAISYDEGETFTGKKVICPTGSAYSAATVLPDGTLGVYYEENGIFGGFTMRFVRFSLKWATGKSDYVFTDENPFRPIGFDPTGINDMVGDLSGQNHIATKVIREGRIIILKDGSEYSTTGVRIR